MEKCRNKMMGSKQTDRKRERIYTINELRPRNQQRYLQYGEVNIERIEV